MPKKNGKRKPKAKKASILDRVEPVEDLPNILSCVFYGRSGTGKTTIAGTFPTPMIFLDIGERGTDSVTDVEGASVLKILEWRDIEDIYWEIKEGGPDLFRTVNIDAMHSMQSLAIIEAKARNNIGPDEKTSQRIFGEASGLMQQWLTNYRDLQDEGIHVNFLAHDKVFSQDTDSDEVDTIAPEVGPKLMPSISGFIMGLVKVAGHTYISETITKAKVAGQKKKRDINYRLRIGPHSYYGTKVRKNKGIELPEFINDPTFDKILKVRKGLSVEEPTSKKAKLKPKKKVKAKAKR